MSGAPPRARLEAVLAEARAELHRYAARLTGSPFDGEDVVQDVIVRALEGVDALDPAAPLRPWLFRIAHNRALDQLRRQAVRRSEPIEAAADQPDLSAADPAESLARAEALGAAVDRFVRLPVAQRSAVILKDVLGHSLEEIAELLQLTVAATKAVLHRGRERLKAINAEPAAPPVARPASEAAARYAALFNRRDWDALRALLADDVRLTQTTYADRLGRKDVGLFFTLYDAEQGWRLAPAHVQGREVLAVYEGPDERPAYFMEIGWRDGRIARIRDFRHARYVGEAVNIVPAAGDA